MLPQNSRFWPFSAETLIIFSKNTYYNYKFLSCRNRKYRWFYPRTLSYAPSTRIGQHRKIKGQDITAVGEHTISNTKHTISVDNVEIIAREEHLWKRKIREAVEIKNHAPTLSLNRDTGYDLPAIFDKLLSHDRPKKVFM